MPFENALRRLGLTPQRAGEYSVKSNIAPAEIAAQQACLDKAYFRQPIIVFRAERRLPMAYEVDSSHVPGAKG
jgi:hypothetical protein